MTAAQKRNGSLQISSNVFTFILKGIIIINQLLQGNNTVSSSTSVKSEGDRTWIMVLDISLSMGDFKLLTSFHRVRRVIMEPTNFKDNPAPTAPRDW